MDKKNRLLLIVISIITMCYFVVMHNFTFIGDDLTYIDRWRNVLQNKGSLIAYPYFCVTHWLNTNGRMANLLTPFLLDIFPKIVTDILLAVSYGLLLVSMCKLSDIWAKSKTACLFLIVIVAFGLPWDDSLLLYDCWLNYPVAATMTLWAVLLMSKARDNFLILIFMFLAGAMHEACGVALSAGLVAYRIVNGKWYGNQCRSSVAYMSGAVFAISSPGIWMRFDGSEPESQMIEVLLKSDYMALVFFAVVIVMWLAGKLQMRLIELVKTKWLIFSVACFVSTLFCAVSGIVGRTGFFAQIFALISLFLLFDIEIIKCKFILGIRGFIVAVLAVNFFGFAYYQSICGQELAKSLILFDHSQTGVIYMDYTNSRSLPFALSGKVIGVPGDEEIWLRHTIEKYYSNGTKKFVVLPLEAKGLLLPESGRGVPLSDGSIIACNLTDIDQELTFEKLPKKTFRGRLTADGRIQNLSGGELFIVSDFKTRTGIYQYLKPIGE